MENIKKINLNKDKRLEDIRNLSLEIQDTKNKKISELRWLAHNIEILTDTNLLKELNKAIDDVENGRYVSEESFLKQIKFENYKSY